MSNDPRPDGCDGTGDERRPRSRARVLLVTRNLPPLLGGWRMVAEALRSGLEQNIPQAEIIPGMPVEAFIQTTERTPFDYLVRPLTSYFGRSMLER